MSEDKKPTAMIEFGLLRISQFVKTHGKGCDEWDESQFTNISMSSIIYSRSKLKGKNYVAVLITAVGEIETGLDWFEWTVATKEYAQDPNRYAIIIG